MSLPNLSGAARLFADVELRYSPQGTAVCKVPLVFNSRRYNKTTQEWEDGDSLFITGTVFGENGEAAAEQLTKGTEVTVTGRAKTRQWTTDTGDKRSIVELLIDSIGVTARAKKSTRSANASGDQWSSPARPAGQTDEPPF